MLLAFLFLFETHIKVNLKNHSSSKVHISTLSLLNELLNLYAIFLIVRGASLIVDCQLNKVFEIIGSLKTSTQLFLTLLRTYEL